MGQRNAVWTAGPSPRYHVLLQVLVTSIFVAVAFGRMPLVVGTEQPIACADLQKILAYAVRCIATQ